MRQQFARQEPDRANLLRAPLAGFAMQPDGRNRRHQRISTARAESGRDAGKDISRTACATIITRLPPWWSDTVSSSARRRNIDIAVRQGNPGEAFGIRDIARDISGALPVAHDPQHFRPSRCHTCLRFALSFAEIVKANPCRP